MCLKEEASDKNTASQNFFVCLFHLAVMQIVQKTTKFQFLLVIKVKNWTIDSN